MNHQNILHKALDCNLYTSLNDRVLFFDGDSVVSPDKINDHLGTQICVTELTEEIKQFNSLVDPSQRITVKDTFTELDLAWNIPQQYIDMNVEEFMWDTFLDEVGSMTSSEIRKRATRLEQEFTLYNEMNLLPVLRVIIYIINTLRTNNVVWGIGRGSCVSSYVLYLLGVHDVDSVAYNLDYKDFLRDSDNSNGEK